MDNAVSRSNGINDAERYLQKLCERTFLRLWSYPGVFRDQSSGWGKKGGKEVCDLLVVFGNHILIFSDKKINFPKTGDLDLDWSRWVRRAVLESGEQLFGAERWIKSHPDRLFIDRECNQVFPIDLPDMSLATFHRVIVAHGASVRCKEVMGGSGSLMILSKINGTDHILKRSDGGMPFVLGQVDTMRGFVHILDDTSLEILLTTLDTIYDFTEYLEKKEKLFEKMGIVGAAGEEELLAYYLANLNQHGEHDFVVEEGLNGVFLDEGFWEDFSNSKERQSQIEANQISYSWDRLIEIFCTHILNDTQYLKDSLGARNQEKIIRFLARESRTRRRMLAKALIDLLETTPPFQKKVRVIQPSKPGDPYYVFLAIPSIQGTPQKEYREVRLDLLLKYCMVVKHRYPNAQDIVGIATESGTNSYRSEDAIYLDTRIWTQDQETEAINLIKDLSLLEHTQTFYAKELEYPASSKKGKRKRHNSKNRKFTR